MSDIEAVVADGMAMADWIERVAKYVVSTGASEQNFTQFLEDGLMSRINFMSRVRKRSTTPGDTTDV